MIGADIEGFLRNADGKFLSALDFIAGDKDTPLPTTHGAIQADGVLGEFNIIPASTREEFIANVTNVISDMNSHIKEFGLKWVPVASAIMESDQITDFRSRQIGCMPDYNAWTVKPNIRDEGVFPGPLRTAAGHIHFSWDGFSKKDKKKMLNVIQLMDLHHAIPGLFLDPDKRRRELYGSAGAFRPKPYGVEFRTSSNFWVRNKELIGWTWDVTQKVLEMSDGDMLPKKDGKMIAQAINKHDTRLGEVLVKKFNVEMP